MSFLPLIILLTAVLSFPTLSLGLLPLLEAAEREAFMALNKPSTAKAGNAVALVYIRHPDVSPDMWNVKFIAEPIINLEPLPWGLP